MDTDFSLDNPMIKKFFEGDNSYKPTSELVYLHSRPLIKPNFIAQINDLVEVAGSKLVSRKVPANSKIVKDLEAIGIKLGVSMGTLNPENPEEVLEHLRELYRLCLKINRS